MSESLELKTNEDGSNLAAHIGQLVKDPESYFFTGEVCVYIKFEITLECMGTYQIVNTTNNDLEFIYSLFEEAIAYQKRKNYPVWNGFDKDVLIEDVAKGRQYKIVSGEEILCIFSVCKSDPVAIYLHRIVVNPKHKGHKHFSKIATWAIDFAKKKKIKFIRMDTWAGNPNILEYYKSHGFKFLEKYTTPDSIELALQQRNLELALLEYVIT